MSLTFRGRAWYIEDLGQRTNGTFVNGTPCRG